MSYVLPVATTETLGGVRPDGVTITIDNGVLSSVTAGSFVNPVITGITTIQHYTEIVTPISNATGTVVHDFLTGGSIFYHTNVQNNFTANFTNVPLTNNRSFTVTLIIEQGATARIPHAVSVNGISQNLFWSTNIEPGGTNNKIEFFTFTIVRRNDEWKISGAVSTYG